MQTNPSHVKDWSTGIDHPLSARAQPAHFGDSALAFIHERLGNGTTLYSSGFESDVAAHVYVQQQFGGIPITRAIANVAQTKAGKSHRSRRPSCPHPPVRVKSLRPSRSSAQSKPEKALLLHLVDDREWTLEYLALEADELVLTYAIPLRLSPEQRVLAHVDASTCHGFRHQPDTHGPYIPSRSALSRQYHAIPITARDPTDGFELIVDPEDPSGWKIPRSGMNLARRRRQQQRRRRTVHRQSYGAQTI